MWAVLKKSHMARFVLSTACDEKDIFLENGEISSGCRGLDHLGMDRSIVAGFPHYLWSHEQLYKKVTSTANVNAGSSATGNQAFLGRLDDAAKVLTNTWEKLFPPCLLSPFYYANLMRLSVLRVLASQMDQRAGESPSGVSDKVHNSADFNVQYSTYYTDEPSCLPGPTSLRLC